MTILKNKKGDIIGEIKDGENKTLIGYLRPKRGCSHPSVLDEYLNNSIEEINKSVK